MSVWLKVLLGVVAAIVIFDLFAFSLWLMSQASDLMVVAGLIVLVTDGLIIGKLVMIGIRKWFFSNSTVE